MERHRGAGRPRRRDRLAHEGDFRGFAFGFVVHVFGVEALVRHCDDRRQRQSGFLRRCMLKALFPPCCPHFRGHGLEHAGNLAQQRGACKREEPLDEKTRHKDRLQQPLQQGVAKHALHVWRDRCPIDRVTGALKPRAQFDGIGARRNEADNWTHEARRVDSGVVKRAEQEIAHARIRGMAQIEFLDAMFELRPIRGILTRHLQRGNDTFECGVRVGHHFRRVGRGSVAFQLRNERGARTRQVIPGLVERRIEGQRAFEIRARLGFAPLRALRFAEPE